MAAIILTVSEEDVTTEVCLRMFTVKGKQTCQWGRWWVKCMPKPCHACNRDLPTQIKILLLAISGKTDGSSNDGLYLVTIKPTPRLSRQVHVTGFKWCCTTARLAAWWEALRGTMDIGRRRDRSSGARNGNVRDFFSVALRARILEIAEHSVQSKNCKHERDSW